MATDPIANTHEYEPAAGGYVLRLYVAGMTQRSTQAIANVRRICERLAVRCDLQVVDLYQQPELAAADAVRAVPTLVRKQPLPQRRFTGDMSDGERILAGLGLPTP